MLRLFLISFFVSLSMQAQVFITVRNNQFMEGENEFSFFGFNAYYLFTETAYGRAYITDEVFDAARKTGTRVVRTWAFYESDDLSDSAVIRPTPYDYNEVALKALDYVVYKARENNLRLILTLLNNNPHYGGIPQYLKWGKKYLSRSFTRNDFFIDDTMKIWYKNYVVKLLNRVNTYTSVPYKDESAIFSFELLNEGTNDNINSAVLFNWYKEMAAFFKSIDNKHLLTTGEMGEDDDRSAYSDVNLFYNSSDFLFNGSKGTSYSGNISIPDIDYGSFHLYTDGWRLHPAAGINWIKEHLFIAETVNKPALLSEFGSRDNKPEVYAKWLDEVSTLNCRSAVIWHYVHPDVYNNDSYGFNLNDTALVNVFRNFIEELNHPVVKPPLPVSAQLYQNYPNPFNPVTTIKYELAKDDEIFLELYTALGERVGVLDEGFKFKGSYELTLSFNSAIYASGTYFYTLRTSEGKITRKLILLK